MSHTMMLLPPRPEVCQQCATEHLPELPHNAHSLYYNTRFYMTHGRHPDWRDAMAHCSDELRHNWTKELERLGIDVAAGQLYPPKPKPRTRGKARRRPPGTCEAHNEH